MNFSKQPPKRDGWYLVVDIQYPVPKPAFITIEGPNKAIYDWGRQLEWYQFKDMYRFGDKIEMPSGEDVQVEY